MKTIHTKEEGIERDNLNISRFMRKYDPDFDEKELCEYDSNWNCLMTALELLQTIEDGRYEITIRKYFGKMTDKLSKDKDKEVIASSLNPSCYGHMIDVYHSIISSCTEIINLRDQYGDKDKEELVEGGIKTSWEFIGDTIFGKHVPVDKFRDDFKYAFPQIGYEFFDDKQLVVIPPKIKRDKVLTQLDFVFDFLKLSGIDNMSQEDRYKTIFEQQWKH